MIYRSSLVIAAALATTLTTTSVRADDFYDSFTGLPKGIYYGTLQELHRGRLPMSQRSIDYMNQHSLAGPVSGQGAARRRVKVH